jgi:hypothetical protein
VDLVASRGLRVAAAGVVGEGSSLGMFKDQLGGRVPLSGFPVW